MNGDLRINIRKVIRDAIEQNLLDKFEDNWHITASRKVDMRDKEKVIRIMMTEGTISTHQSINTIDAQAEIIIVISSKSDDDEHLDTISDYCNSAITNNYKLNKFIKGITQTGFEYPIEDQDAYSDLILAYSVIF